MATLNQTSKVKGYKIQRFLKRFVTWWDCQTIRL